MSDSDQINFEDAVPHNPNPPPVPSERKHKPLTEAELAYRDCWQGAEALADKMQELKEQISNPHQIIGLDFIRAATDAMLEIERKIDEYQENIANQETPPVEQVDPSFGDPKQNGGW